MRIRILNACYSIVQSVGEEVFLERFAFGMAVAVSYGGGIVHPTNETMDEIAASSVFCGVRSARLALYFVRVSLADSGHRRPFDVAMDTCS